MPPRSTASAHSSNSSRRHSWWRHAVQARTSDRVRSGCSTPMICAITPPIDAPITWARSMCSWSSTAIDVERHPLERVRLGRRAGPADAPVVDGDAPELAAQRQPLQRPARASRCRGPGSSRAACRPDARRRRSGSSSRRRRRPPTPDLLNGREPRCSRSRTRGYPCTDTAPGDGRAAPRQACRQTRSSTASRTASASSAAESGSRSPIAPTTIGRAEVHAPRREREPDRTAGPHAHRDHRVAERGDEQLGRRDAAAGAPPRHAERQRRRGGRRAATRRRRPGTRRRSRACGAGR